MNSFIDIFRSFVTIFCIVSLALCAAVALIAFIVREWRVFRRYAGNVGFYALAVVFILYAGTKPPTVTVTWDEHFSNKSYTVDTNDPRRISFAWSSPAWMPETARAILHAYGRAAGVPDAASVTNAPMSAGAMTAVMQHDATNYVYFVECDWSPEPTVVTNGVYHVRAVENDEKVVPIGVSIRLPEQQENQQ